ncbi:HAD family hydrolase [bacterium]|nr:HAD family hydrolase [bacterium]
MKTLTFQNRPVHAVCIDFWNTISTASRGSERLGLRIQYVQKYAAGRGIELSEEVVREALHAYSRSWHDHWRTHHITPDAVYAARTILENLYIEQDAESLQVLARELDEVMLQAMPEPVEGVIDTIRKLANVVPIALICDTGISGPSTIDKMLDRWGVLQFIQHRIYSSDVGVSKPDSLMFDRAIERLGVAHDAALHIGDNERTDIIGAKNAGLMAIRLEALPAFEKYVGESQADKCVKSWEEVQIALGV